MKHEIKTLIDTLTTTEQHLNELKHLKDTYTQLLILNCIRFTPKYKKKKSIKPIYIIKTHVKEDTLQYYKNDKLDWICFKQKLDEPVHLYFTPKYKNNKPIKPILLLNNNNSIGKINIVQHFVKYYDNGQLECISDHNQFKIYYEDGKLNVDYDCSGQMTTYHDNGQIKFIGLCKILDYDYIVKCLSSEKTRLWQKEKAVAIYKKGKCYYESGELRYEGEFNEKGYYKKGKVYWENGNIMYEGDFHEENNVNDDETSLLYKKGKEYYKNGNIMYEGEYTDTCEYIKGKEYYESGELQHHNDGTNAIEYYKNGKTHFEYDCSNCIGKAYYETGVLKYEGEFEHYEGCRKKESFKERKFKEYWKTGKLKVYNNGKYIKEYYKNGGTHFVYDCSNRIGKAYYETEELKYEGEFKDFQYNGKGKEYYETGELKYEGEWNMNRYWGQGTSYYENGNIKMKGTISYRVFTGKYYQGNTLYDGQCFNGIYNGKYYNGIFQGKGKLYINNQLDYYGYWKDGKRHGFGKSYYEYKSKYAHRQVEFEGEWENDKKIIGKGKEYCKTGKILLRGVNGKVIKDPF